jgi:hypothetical protein
MIKDMNSQMLIVEKYERLIHSLYPILQSVPRSHGIARNMALEDLLSVPSAMIIAGKTGQVSKLYLIDAKLSTLRYWMRFFVVKKCMTSNQEQTAQAIMAEVGSILGTWIKSKKSQG